MSMVCAIKDLCRESEVEQKAKQNATLFIPYKTQEFCHIANKYKHAYTIDSKEHEASPMSNICLVLC